MVETPKNEKQKERAVLNSIRYSDLPLPELYRDQSKSDRVIRWLNGDLGMFVGVALGLLIAYVFFIDEPPSWSWQTWKAPLTGVLIGYTSVKLAVLWVNSRLEKDKFAPLTNGATSSNEQAKSRDN